ncbi:MAG: hypothetical protein JWO92_1186 [Chitinophagaceae bacterium]|nr:hypothetical protein [Chitinophagaceae bacterium]
MHYGKKQIYFHCRNGTSFCNARKGNRTVQPQQDRVGGIAGTRVADVLRVIITVTDTKENATKISAKIEGQIDVISVKLFEET